MTTAEDAAELFRLVAAAQAGDRAALERLLAQTRPQVYRYVLARLADPGLADDVTQEVSMTVVAALPRYVDTGRSILAWIFGIAANKISETRRAQARCRELSVEQVPEGVVGDALGPEAAALRLDATRQMAHLLERLPHAHAEVLRLRVAAGLSAAETAAVLGMSTGAVRVTQHRALAALRTALAAAAPAPARMNEVAL
jgi:RNA polymerase sigma-70 factor (ECF subfamily)